MICYLLLHLAWFDVNGVSLDAAAAPFASAIISDTTRLWYLLLESFSISSRRVKHRPDSSALVNEGTGRGRPVFVDLSADLLLMTSNNASLSNIGPICAGDSSWAVSALKYCEGMDMPCQHWTLALEITWSQRPLEAPGQVDLR